MKRHSFYVDSHRHLIGDAVLGIQGEHNSDVICIICPRYWGEIDLSLSQMTLGFNSGEYFEELKPQSVTVDSDITLYFPITRNLTAKSGEVVLGLVARIGEECVFKTHTLTCVVKKSAISPEEVSSAYPEELTHIHNILSTKVDQTALNQAKQEVNRALSLLEENKADKNLISEDIQSLGEELSESIAKVDADKISKLSSHVGNLAGLSDGTVCDSSFSLEMLEGGFVKLSHNGETVLVFEKRNLNITDFNDVQTIVRSGLSNRYFRVGDTLRCKKGEDIIEWVIIGIDEDTPSDSRYTHSLTLMAKNIYDTFQYDSIQALYHSKSFLDPGTFHMNIGGQLYSFTSSYPITQGAQVLVNSARTVVQLFPHAYSESYYEKCTLEKVSEVPENSTELTPLNNIAYATGGCNDYLNSPLKQWLNSQDGTDWWSPDTEYSRRHYKVGYTKGFLYDIEREFLNVLGNVKKKTHKDGENIISDEKVFVLSAQESGVSNMYSEGKKYSYFKSEQERVKTFNGTPTRWWLRTPRVDEQNEAWTVDTNGGLNHNICSSAAGVCPVVCIV